MSRIGDYVIEQQAEQPEPVTPDPVYDEPKTENDDDS